MDQLFFWEGWMAGPWPEWSRGVQHSETATGRAAGGTTADEGDTTPFQLPLGKRKEENCPRDCLL